MYIYIYILFLLNMNILYQEKRNNSRSKNAKIVQSYLYIWALSDRI